MGCETKTRLDDSVILDGFKMPKPIIVEKSNGTRFVTSKSYDNQHR